MNIFQNEWINRDNIGSKILFTNIFIKYYDTFYLVHMTFKKDSYLFCYWQLIIEIVRLSIISSTWTILSV